MIILEDNAVYAVLEYHKGKQDEYLHGVYTTREIADNVAQKLWQRKSGGYVCVLKQRIQGPVKKVYDSLAFKNCVYYKRGK